MGVKKNIALYLVFLAFAVSRNACYLWEKVFHWEDGTVFFSGWWNAGWHCLFRSYAGYLHVGTRLLAWPGSLAPLPYASAVFSATAVLCVAGVALWTARSVPGWRGLALGACVVAAPVSPFFYTHLTNLQWFLGLLWFVWLIGPEPVTKAAKVGVLGTGFILALTGPYVFVAWPFWAWRWWSTRRAFYAHSLAVWSVPMAVQMGTMLRNGVSPGLDFSKWFAETELLASGLVVVSLASLPLLWSIRDRLPWHDLWLLPLAGLAFLVMGYLRTVHGSGVMAQYGSGGRYYMESVVFLMWCACWLFQGRSGLVRWVAAAGLAAALWTSGRHWSDPRRFSGQNLAAVEQTLAAGKPVTVDIQGWGKMRLRPR